MICVPLDDVEDVLQRRLDRLPPWPGGEKLLLDLIDELTALQVDTDADACRECGKTEGLIAWTTPDFEHAGVYCRPCAVELGIDTRPGWHVQ